MLHLTRLSTGMFRQTAAVCSPQGLASVAGGARFGSTGREGIQPSSIGGPLRVVWLLVAKYKLLAISRGVKNKFSH